MPKSAKKAASKVDSTPAVEEQPTEAAKNGKRDAEENIEKNVVSSKKQKIVNGGVSPAVETKKVKTRTKKIKTKKQESSSSEFEEKEKKEEPKEPDAVVKNGDVATVKNDDLDNESESNDRKSSDEEEPKEPDAVVKNGDVATVKNDDLDNESESNDRKSPDEEDAKATSEAKAPVEPAAKVEEESHDDKENSDEEPAKPQAVKEANIGSDSAEKEDESKAIKKIDADVEMVDAPSAKKAPQTSSTPQATESKTLFMGNLSFSIEISDVINFFKDACEVVEVRFTVRDGRFAGYGHVEFATRDAAKKALKLDGELLLDRDVRLDFAKEKCAHTPNNGNERSSQKSGQSLTYIQDADMELVDASSAKKAPQTSATPQATESKILFVGNLSFSIKESDVLNFFKDAGEVVGVRLALKDDRFAGYGHVEFATHDAAQKAFKLDGELLLDRNVRLDFAKERPQTPSNGNERSSQKSGQSQGLTVFVKGFGIDDGFDSVRSTLEEHFGQCGEITRMAIPKDFESGGPKGVAFIDFTNSEAFNKALELNGSEVSGGTITVEEAKQSSRYNNRDGGGRGGRGRSGGRGRGRGRGR